MLRPGRLPGLALHPLRGAVGRAHVPRPARSTISSSVRYGLQAAAYPMQVAVNSPPAAWHWLTESFQTRERAAGRERAPARRRHATWSCAPCATRRWSARTRELRGLHAALPPLAKHWLLAEIVDIQLSSLRQRLLINHGAAQRRVPRTRRWSTARGLLGQTTHVGPWSAEVILITDPEHAVPVQVERNGLRTIAVGAGDTSSLAAAVSGRQLRRQERRPAGHLGSRRRVPGGLPGGAHHRSAPRRGAAAGAGARRAAGARRHRHAR